MKFLFIVQGEGRGHLTQAVALEDILLRNGHEVVGVLVGKSSSRTLPDFFKRQIQAPLKRFVSPNFLPTAKNKRASLTRSIIYNMIRFPEFCQSMCFINRQIKETKADIVINFYELLVGYTYFLFRPSIPYICIGHQYLFLHRDFKFPPHINKMQLSALRLFTRMTSLNASKRLALSFYRMQEDNANKISVVPPLLRREIFSVKPKKGNYIHGYMVNSGFAEDVMAFHTIHPEIPLRFFWDKTNAKDITEIDKTLYFYRIDDIKFIEQLAGCHAYATTAGFESVCEALLFGKPILMIPAHIEQDCNAFDAMKVNAGIISDTFDMEKLLRYASIYHVNQNYICWASSSELRIIREIEEIVNQYRSYKNTTTAVIENMAI